MRGRLTIGGAPACLSHARITIEGAGSYDEVAYKLGGDRWEVVASYLDETEAALLFSALDGSTLNAEVDVAVVAAVALGRN